MTAAPFVDDPDFVLYVGDVRDALAGLPDESVHCVVTSPPYWGLRDYSAEGQLGLEATPDEYVQNMVAVFREVRRVLRRDGTCWLNLGDSYASGPRGNAPDDWSTSGLTRVHTSARYRETLASGTAQTRDKTKIPGLKPKDLVGIPWRVAFALQADGWYLRADVIWSKPNPMPESVTDRPTKAHEYLFLLTRSPRYFFDADAVREAHTSTRWGGPTITQPPDTKYAEATANGFAGAAEALSRPGREWNAYPTGGRNIRSVWEITTEPYPDAHFATFPQALVEPCVKAGTSERGCCPVCGAPWEREVGRDVPARQVDPSELDRYGTGEHGVHRKIGGQYQKWLDANPSVTIGWRPSCDHDAEPVPCVVMDPFLGSGTTALVARRLGRHSIGIELNEDYARLAAQRTCQQSLLA